MPKKPHQKHIRLSDPLFERLTETAKKADMSVNQLITEAIKFYLYEKENDPYLHLLPKGEEPSALSKLEKTHLYISLQTLYLASRSPEAKVLKEASAWAAEQISKLFEQK